MSEFREMQIAINAIQAAIDAADKALLDAGISSLGSLANRITRLATERDLALAGCTKPASDSDRCPGCGYTELDVRELGDHGKCSRFPYFRFEKIAQSESDIAYQRGYKQGFDRGMAEATT